MSSTDRPPLKIHVAKAKDLPFSWYDLVLRPDKFAEHLKTLQENPEAPPSTTHLIVTFLDKAGVLSVLPNATTANFSELATGEREAKLVQCALSFVGFRSAPDWDDLPLSVQFCLLSFLAARYPPPAQDEGVESEATAAHVMLSSWVLRFMTQQCYATCEVPRPPMQTWDTTCPTPDQIKDLVKQRVEESVTILTNFLTRVEARGDAEVPTYWTVPRVGVSLPLLSGAQGEMNLEPFKEGQLHPLKILFKDCLCELSYTLGCYHFVEGHYPEAHIHLQTALEFLIIKANLHTAVCEYGAALEGYMEAAALSSHHFLSEVPQEVWSQTTLRRVIKCCCKLQYCTQAVLLCQLLKPVDYERAFAILKEHASDTG